jgi:hypothetical protein
MTLHKMIKHQSGVHKWITILKQLIPCQNVSRIKENHRKDKLNTTSRGPEDLKSKPESKQQTDFHYTIDKTPLATSFEDDKNMELKTMTPNVMHAHLHQGKTTY